MTSQVFDSPFENNSPGDPQLFIYSPVSLKEIATVKLAIELWYASVLRKDHAVSVGNEIYEAFEDMLKIRDRENGQQISTSVENLSLPGQIENCIKHAVKTVCDRVSTWLRLERDLIVLDLSDFSFSYSKLRRYLRCLTWEPNGEINYAKTAKKFLPEINSTAMRCKIMCKYCFEDEIRNISPEELRQYRPNSRLGSYWKNSIKNGFLFSDHLYSVPPNSICTWTALEYLWDNLPKGERRIQFISNLLISNHIVRKYQKRLFAKMTETERCEIIAHIPANIIINFWFHCSEFELAFAIWIRIKDQISESVFFSLIRGAVLNHRVNSSLEEDASMLIEIWQTASDDFRNFILNSEANLMKVIEAYFTPVSFPSPAPRNIKFLLLVLSSIDPHRRIKIIADRGIGLIENNDVDSARDVIKFCLDSCNDSMKLYIQRKIFKQCNGLIKVGDFKRLIALSKLFFPKLNSEIKHGKVLIESYQTDRPPRYIFQAEEWKNICDFIDKSYLKEPHIATEMKKKIILGCSTSFNHYFPSKTAKRHGFWYSRNYLNEITGVVEKFLSEEEKATFKRNLLLDFFRKIASKLFWLHFEPDVFHEFELWFLGSEENISKFKLLLPIDDFFDEIFTAAFCNLNDHLECPAENIIAVENFLKWYFPTPQEIKEYKLSKIHHFEENNALKKFFNNYRNENDDCFELKKTLLWFFDGDEDQVFKFKSDRCNDVFSKIINIPFEVYDYRLLAFQCRMRRKMCKYSENKA